MGCECFSSRFKKKRLYEARMTLWASTCWPSSQARVTSVNSNLCPGPKKIRLSQNFSQKINKMCSKLDFFFRIIHPAKKNPYADILKTWVLQTCLYIYIFSLNCNEKHLFDHKLINDNISKCSNIPCFNNVNHSGFFFCNGATYFGFLKM